MRREAPELLARTLRSEDGVHRPKGGRLRTGPDVAAAWPAHAREKSSMTESPARVVCKKLRLPGVRATTQRMIPKTRLTIIRKTRYDQIASRSGRSTSHRSVNIPLSRLRSLWRRPANSRRTTSMSATRSVHQAARQVRRWIASSSCPIPAEGFLRAGRTITGSNKNRLASRIEADKCNQRTNINASGIGVCRLQLPGLHLG